MKIAYDLHVHSCLSPCGDDEMTPANIAGMSMLQRLDMVALTDHNSCKNCPAFFAACKQYEITPVAGMELTAAEDVHIICLFPTLESAMEFDIIVQSRAAPVKNRRDIFGNQIIMSISDEPAGEVENLLIAATSISITESVALVRGLGGIAYPAHIDRQSNGIIAALGDIPADAGFTAAELKDYTLVKEYKGKYPLLKGMNIVSCSDAHSLEAINGAKNFLDLPEKTAACLIENLFDKKITK